jgi:hypothetical protein
MTEPQRLQHPHQQQQQPQQKQQDVVGRYCGYVGQTFQSKNEVHFQIQRSKQSKIEGISIFSPGTHTHTHKVHT